MTKIYLIRHGESVANTESIYQGQTYDTPLSDLGMKQVERLAQRFQNVALNSVIASPLKRTIMTADAVAQHKNLKVKPEKKIIETNHGEWERKHKDIIEKSWPEIYKKWQKFPSGVRFPDGEHFLETQKRVVEWWNSVANGEGDYLVVTHDNIIRILIAKILNMKLNRIWKFHLQPTSVTLIEVEKNIPKLVYLNNYTHLGDLQADLAIHAL